MKKGQLNIETELFIEKLASGHTRPLYELSPDEARQVLKDVQDIFVEMAEAEIEDINIPYAPDQTLPVKILRPAGHNGRELPVIYYIHGGGWVMGDFSSHERLLREICARTGAAIVFPDYTRAPEAQYPAQIYQLFGALQYIAAQSEFFHFKTTHIVVAGDSVGGNMATVMAMMAKSAGKPKIALQLLLYPVANADFETLSYQEFAEGPWLTRQAMQWFWDAYLPDHEKRREITASPLLADSGTLEGLPPALLIIAENDVLRDEGEAYARKLIDAKVEVSSLRVNHTIHDFMMLSIKSTSKKSSMVTANSNGSPLGAG